ncbi:LVIVD repeat-containing protein [Sulfitobacter sp.]|uniref:LVIVD repeat-containing protein n=1 Tax=Sulfitobacter sp. TaxID=1903071 RepID=UPI0030017242
MAHHDLPTPDYAKNMKLIGHSDQGGRPDGVQLMVNKGFAFTGHMFSKGFSVIDVRDPRDPKPVNYIPAPANTWNIHLQTHEDLLLVINAKDMFASVEFQDESEYYKGSIGKKVGTAQQERVRDWTAGMSVYDISNPAEPRKISFMPVEGGGIHRLWYTGGPWAYASVLLDGFTDYIFMTIDMSDPANPKEAGRFWLPGMNLAAGETGGDERRGGLHHAIIHGDTAYGAWRDEGMVVIDVSDRTNPELFVHKNWSPPFGGGTHNCLPLPDRDLLVVVDEAVLDNCEDGTKHIWMFDNRVPSNPVSISTFPIPSEADYCKKGGHFGPHNIYENRPDGLVSDQLIFSAMQNAGIRVTDISNEYRPTEVAAFVPPKPNKLIDQRPRRPLVIQNCDVYVDKQGLIYANDYNGGLYILEYEG